MGRESLSLRFWAFFSPFFFFFPSLLLALPLAVAEPFLSLFSIPKTPQQFQKLTFLKAIKMPVSEYCVPFPDKTSCCVLFPETPACRAALRSSPGKKHKE